MKSSPKHWFLLSYWLQQPGNWVPASSVVSNDTMNLSIPTLIAMRKLKGVSEQSVLISVSYLGFMTEREVNGMPEIDPPSLVSEPFKEGMHAAIIVDKTDAFQPMNPYNAPDKDQNCPHVVYAADEWRLGYKYVRDAQFKGDVGISHTRPPTTVDHELTKQPPEVDPQTPVLQKTPPGKDVKNVR